MTPNQEGMPLFPRGKRPKPSSSSATTQSIPSISKSITCHPAISASITTLFAFAGFILSCLVVTSCRFATLVLVPSSQISTIDYLPFGVFSILYQSSSSYSYCISYSSINDFYNSYNEENINNAGNANNGGNIMMEDATNEFSLGPLEKASQAFAILSLLLGLALLIICTLTIFLRWRKCYKITIATVAFAGGLFQLFTFLVFSSDKCTWNEVNINDGNANQANSALSQLFNLYYINGINNIDYENLQDVHCNFNEGAVFSLSASICYIVMGVVILLIDRPRKWHGQRLVRLDWSNVFDEKKGRDRGVVGGIASTSSGFASGVSNFQGQRHQTMLSQTGDIETGVVNAAAIMAAGAGMAGVAAVEEEKIPIEEEMALEERLSLNEATRAPGGSMSAQVPMRDTSSMAAMTAMGAMGIGNESNTGESSSDETPPMTNVVGKPWYYASPSASPSRMTSVPNTSNPPNAPGTQSPVRHDRDIATADPILRQRHSEGGENDLSSAETSDSVDSSSSSGSASQSSSQASSKWSSTSSSSNTSSEDVQLVSNASRETQDSQYSAQSAQTALTTESVTIATHPDGSITSTTVVHHRDQSQSVKETVISPPTEDEKKKILEGVDNAVRALQDGASADSDEAVNSNYIAVAAGAAVSRSVSRMSEVSDSDDNRVHEVSPSVRTSDVSESVKTFDVVYAMSDNDGGQGVRDGRDEDGDNYDVDSARLGDSEDETDVMAEMNHPYSQDESEQDLQESELEIIDTNVITETNDDGSTTVITTVTYADGSQNVTKEILMQQSGETTQSAHSDSTGEEGRSFEENNIVEETIEEVHNTDGSITTATTFTYADGSQTTREETTYPDHSAASEQSFQSVPASMRSDIIEESIEEVHNTDVHRPSANESSSVELAVHESEVVEESIEEMHNADGSITIFKTLIHADGSQTTEEETSYPQQSMQSGQSSVADGSLPPASTAEGSAAHFETMSGVASASASMAAMSDIVEESIEEIHNADGSVTTYRTLTHADGSQTTEEETTYQQHTQSGQSSIVEERVMQSSIVEGSAAHFEALSEVASASASTAAKSDIVEESIEEMRNADGSVTTYRTLTHADGSQTVEEETTYSQHTQSGQSSVVDESVMQSSTAEGSVAHFEALSEVASASAPTEAKSDIVEESIQEIHNLDGSITIHKTLTHADGSQTVQEETTYPSSTDEGNALQVVSGDGMEGSTAVSGGQQDDVIEESIEEVHNTDGSITTKKTLTHADGSQTTEEETKYPPELSQSAPISDEEGSRGRVPLSSIADASAGSVKSTQSSKAGESVPQFSATGMSGARIMAEGQSTTGASAGIQSDIIEESIEEVYNQDGSITTFRKTTHSDGSQTIQEETTYPQSGQSTGASVAGESNRFGGTSGMGSATYSSTTQQDDVIEESIDETRNADGSTTTKKILTHTDGSQTIHEETTFPEAEQTSFGGRSVSQSGLSASASISQQGDIIEQSIEEVHNANGSITTFTKTTHADGSQTVKEETTYSDASAAERQTPSTERRAALTSNIAAGGNSSVASRSAECSEILEESTRVVHNADGSRTRYTSTTQADGSETIVEETTYSELSPQFATMYAAEEDAILGRLGGSSQANTGNISQEEVTSKLNADGSITTTTIVFHTDGTQTIKEETSYPEEETNTLGGITSDLQAGNSSNDVPEREEVSIIENEDGTTTRTTTLIYPDGRQSVTVDTTLQGEGAQSVVDVDNREEGNVAAINLSNLIMTRGVGSSRSVAPQAISSSLDTTNQVIGESYRRSLNSDGTSVVESLRGDGRRSVRVTTPEGEVHETITDGGIVRL